MHNGGKTYLGMRKNWGDNVWETQGGKKMKRVGIRKENREFKKGRGEEGIIKKRQHKKQSINV